MYSIRIVHNGNEIDDLHVDTEAFYSLPTLDEENQTIVLDIFIKNEVEETDLYHRTLLFKIGISPSIFAKFDNLVLVNLTAYDNQNIQITSDRQAFLDNGHIGILFTDVPEIIANYHATQYSYKKIILVPTTILPQQEVRLQLVIYYSQDSTTTAYARNKFYNIFNILYDVSKTYVSSIETVHRRNFEYLYSYYGRNNSITLINKNSLLTGIYYSKDIFLLELLSNGIYKRQDASQDDFLLKYEKNFLSNFSIQSTTNTQKFLPTKFVLSNNSLIGSPVSLAENQTISFDEYFASVFYTVFAEIFRPYIINSGFLPISTESNVKNIAISLRKLLDDLNVYAARGQVNVYYDAYYGYSVLPRKQDVFFVLAYVLSTIFVNFVQNLVSKGFLRSVPAEVVSLNSKLAALRNSVLNKRTLDKINYISDDLEIDFLVSILVFLFYSRTTTKQIVSSTPQLEGVISLLNSYIFNISRSLANISVGFDPNTLISTASNLKLIFNKMFLLSIYDSLYSAANMKLNLDTLLSTFGVVSKSLTTNKKENYQLVKYTLNSFSGTNTTMFSNNNFVYTSLGPNAKNMNFTGLKVALTDGTNLLYVFDSEAFSIYTTETDLYIRVNNSFFKVDRLNGQYILSNLFYTLDSYLNNLHFYLRSMATVLDDNYFFSPGGNTITEIYSNMLVEEYIKYVLAQYVNNKVSFNSVNFRFLLQTV